MYLSQLARRRFQSIRPTYLPVELQGQETESIPQPAVAHESAAESTRPSSAMQASPTSGGMRYWEPFAVFLLTLALLATFTQHIVAYLTPTSGDEPFYLMTAISIIKDGDLNECNNYVHGDDALLYPSFYSFDGVHAYASFPADWVGWRGAPFPLPPHAGHIVPASRQCASNYNTYPVNYDNPTGELYSKHGLGLSLLVLPAFAWDGRLTVVFFLNLLGALLAANIYLLAREGTGKLVPAVLTWIAFAFTVPLMPYSYLIFPELPAALLILYAFRRIKLMNNNVLQIWAVGLCIAALPWFHYRFAPVSVGLVLYYFFRDRSLREKGQWTSWTLLMTPVVLSAVTLMLFFYQRYRLPFPNPEDHAGISDVAGTIRGAVGLFLDQQWGLFVAAPVFILVIVGVVLKAQEKIGKSDLGWIAVVAVPYFLVIANYAQWWGEWCPPARYLAPILPLLALPFSFALGNIKSAIFKGIYGVLLLLSFLTMWGYLYQPQWMYNQPDGKAALFVNGLSGVFRELHFTLFGSADVVAFFPSFVRPYFAYFQSRASGDAASAAAWRASFWPLLIVFVVVLASLMLAWFGQGRNDAASGESSAGNERQEDESSARIPDGAPGPGLPTVASIRHKARAIFLPVSTYLASLAQSGSVLKPAYAGAAYIPALPSAPVRFQTEAAGEAREAAPLAASANGHSDTPVAAPADGAEATNGVEHSPLADATGVPDSMNGKVAEDLQAAPTVADERKKSPAVLAPVHWLWKTRGLWLGSAGIALAMNGQRVLTIDKDVISSIRWYAVGIIVTLVAWLGTYKYKTSMVAVPSRPRTKKVVAARQKVVAALPDGVEHAAQVALVPPLPVRRRVVLAEVPDSSEHEQEETHTPLPVRSKRATAQPVVEMAADNAPLHRADTGPLKSADTGPLTAAGTVPLPVAVTDSVPLVAEESAPVVTPEIAPAPKRFAGLISRFSFLISRPWREQHPVLGGAWPRYLLAFGALALNLWCADQIRKDYFSSVGGWGWALSLVLLAAAFLREPKRAATPVDDAAFDIDEQAALGMPRWLEISILVGIIALAFAIRIYRLDDLSGGMHGDEGETGMDALSIFQGDKVSPFMTGWFSHPNFSFFSVAIMMKMFGTGLFGLRIFSVILGTLMVLPFYGLVRLWFGVRAAIIASILLAVMDVSIYFGKLGLNNITTPFFLVLGFYFLFRGMKSLRTLDFVLSAYGFMLTLYFYFGGRLTPFMVAGVLGYLFLFLPLVRVPGSYFDLRRANPRVSPGKALLGAFAVQGGLLRPYLSKLALFIVASICLASPWLVYYLDHRAEMDGRANDKVIFNPANQGRMEGQYHATHDPLYLGIRLPQPSDIYPWLPVVFERTPVSVQLVKDGFWPRVIWGQTTTTLSMFTYRADASSFYTFTGEPASKPIEAVFLIIGLAYALWRWKDSRMGTLSIWFWATVFAGGVFTIDAPYAPRIVGAVPAMAILIAIPLNKLASELIRAVGGLVESAKAIRWAKPRLVAGQAVTGIALVGLMANLGATNVNDYFNRYMAAWPYPEVAGQAYFVQHMNDKVMAEGRPTPHYFDLGMHFIYWGHGDNRFVNHGTPGDDMTNPTNELPILNNEDRDMVFMVWGLNIHYLNEIKAYYPGGEEGNFMYGPNGQGPNLFAYYRVTKEQIDAQRITHATYTPAQGPAVTRDEPGFGTTGSAPMGLQYPLQATWAGDVVAPAYGQYSFSLDTTEPGSMTLDGQQVLTNTAGAKNSQVQLLLARGPHEVVLKGALADAASQVTMKWSSNGQTFAAVPRQYVWNGWGRALYGEVGPMAGDLTSPAPGAAAGGGVITTRIDGFLGFKHAPDALTGGPLRATWKGELTIPQQGTYGFETNSNGDSVVLIDNSIVVNNIQGGTDAHDATGQADLAAGKHSFEVRYNWQGGTGYMEAFWTPPGGQRVLIDSSVLHTDAGIITPGLSVTEPPPVQLIPAPAARVIEPDIAFGAGDLKTPRGIAVDKSGNIYVGDVGNHRVVVYGSDGKVARTWGTAPPEVKQGETPPPPKPGEFGQINDLAVGADGLVYVFDDRQRMQAFTPQGEFKGSYEAADLNLYGPNGIATGGKPSNPSGSDIYIASTGQNRILHVPPIAAVQSGQAKIPDSLESITIGTGGTSDHLEQPVDVVADPSGSGVLYTIDLKDRIVQLAPPAKPGDPWTISKQWPVPVGRADGGSRLAISTDGLTVYMSDPDKKRVAVLDLTNNAVSYFGKQGTDAGQFNEPSGVAVGPDGKVYVLDWANGNVQVFAPNKLK